MYFEVEFLYCIAPPAMSLVWSVMLTMCESYVVTSDNIRGFSATMWSFRELNTWANCSQWGESNFIGFGVFGSFNYNENTNVRKFIEKGLIIHRGLCSVIYGTLLCINWFFKNEDKNDHDRLETWPHPEPSILCACVECPELTMTNCVVWVSLEQVYHIVLCTATLWICLW